MIDGCPCLPCLLRIQYIYIYIIYTIYIIGLYPFSDRVGLPLHNITSSGVKSIHRRRKLSSVGGGVVLGLKIEANA